MPRVIAFGLLAASTFVTGQQSTPAAPAADTQLTRRLDVVVPRTLEATGTPSVSVAVVRGGSVVLTRAWGLARVESRTTATPAMRYPIGSVAKQFTAAAMLLLQQDGKLSLDDRVSRYLPDVAHADQVAIRQLLNHTAGYDDYWAQDFVPDYLLKTADVPQILREWGGRPLTFTPGAEFRYSNTNYVIAGAIIEKVSGGPFFRFLQSRIFGPLGMRSAFDYVKNPLPSADAAGYFKYALGPLRPARREADAWLFGAGSLAMTASDLATWDRSVMSRTLLSEASYREQQTEARRADGARAATYGLGVELAPRLGRRAVSHLGGGAGVMSANWIFPDDRAAVVVLSNGKGRAAWSIADFIIGELFATGVRPDKPEEVARPAPPPAAATLGMRTDVVKARRILEDLQKGVLDRSAFTENGNAFFSKQALADFSASLAPLGPVTVWPSFQGKRGSLAVRGYNAWFATTTLLITIMEAPDGRLEQFQVAVAPPQWK
jgi:CubicO group peptidase (beta-lactamase class C family)